MIITRDWLGRTVFLPEGWHPWFAWRPVRLTGTFRWRWLVTVERLFRVSGGWDSYGLPTHYRDDPYTTQALADQKITDYPGCRRGIMYCRSTVCGCHNESSPHPAFVSARATILRREAEETRS